MAIRTLDVPMHDALPKERGWGRAFWLFVKKNPLGAAGGLLMLLLIVAAVLAEVLATHNPIRTSNRVLVAPGAEFWLGTDNLGRDLDGLERLARTILHAHGRHRARRDLDVAARHGARVPDAAS